MDERFRNDPFFEGAPPPAIPTFPHASFGHRSHEPLALSPFGFGHGMGMGMGMGLVPFGGPSPFSMMNHMMGDMDTMMRRMQGEANQGQCYSSSSTTMMQYSSDGQGGAPHVYHATSSTRQAPGGVKETRKAVKDSHTGVQKMAVGHHLGERSHTIERSVNAKTGERAENQEFINLDETEGDSFGSEWREKTRSHNRLGLEQSRHNHFSNSRGLPSPSSRPSNPERGGRVKRKNRPASMSAEDLPGVDECGVHQAATSSRSQKMSRTKSPPYVPKPTKAAPQSHSHSGHTYSHAPAQPQTSPTTSARTTKNKQTSKKTISFAL